MHFIRNSLAITAVASLAPLGQALPTSTNLTSRHDTRDENIVGGHPPYPGHATFAAFLSDTPRTKFCSSVLVSPTKVLTAAHCVFGDKPATNYTVRVGTHHQNHGGELIRLRDLRIHPAYNPANGSKVNDVAVLTLEHAAPSHVLPAALPPQGFTPIVGQSVELAGWGIHAMGDRVRHQLGEVEVQVMDPAICTDYYGTKFSESGHLCLGVPGGGKGGCKGDSGGPAFIDNKMVIGLSSFHGNIGCAVERSQTVYTRVDHNLDFILPNM